MKQTNAAIYRKFNQIAYNASVHRSLVKRRFHKSIVKEIENHVDANGGNIMVEEKTVDTSALSKEKKKKEYVATKLTVVGCGNGGGQVTDRFASITDVEGNPVYTCLAINSNKGDLDNLKYVPQENRIDLGTGGMGKKPKLGLEKIANDPAVSSIMTNFVENQIPLDNELVVFVAVLGGGTGTATILKLVEDFNEKYNSITLNDVVRDMLANITEQLGGDEAAAIEFWKENAEAMMKIAQDNFESAIKKIGIIAYIADKNDIASKVDVIQEFTEKLWEIAKPKYDLEGNEIPSPVSFIMFPDNQKAIDEFNANKEVLEPRYKNALNYANALVVDTLHYLNRAPKIAEENRNLDTADFKRTFLENSGLLVIGKSSKKVEEVHSSKDIVELLLSSVGNSDIHTPVKLIDEESKEQARLMNVGLSVAIDDSVSEEKIVNRYADGGFLLDARLQLSEKLFIEGEQFEGYVSVPNDGNISAITFFKTDVLPERLTSGLALEHEEYLKKKLESAAKYRQDNVVKVSNTSASTISLASLGIGVEAEKEEISDKPQGNKNVDISSLVMNYGKDDKHAKPEIKVDTNALKNMFAKSKK